MKLSLELKLIDILGVQASKFWGGDSSEEDEDSVEDSEEESEDEDDSSSSSSESDTDKNKKRQNFMVGSDSSDSEDAKREVISKSKRQQKALYDTAGEIKVSRLLNVANISLPIATRSSDTVFICCCRTS